MINIERWNDINGNEKLPFVFYNIGRWWGTDKINKCEMEIDIYAVDDENNAIFGECKWRNELTDTPIINDLINKSNIFSTKNKYYVLFSKSGFTAGAIKYANQSKNILLFSLAEM